MAGEQEVVVLNWKKATNTVLDGKGGWFNEGRPTQLVIKSWFQNGEWKRPQNFVFQNWKLNGSIRVLGAGTSSSRPVKQSSFSLGHTQRMQEAAPNNITFSGLTLKAHRRIPVVIGPGATRITLRDTTFRGRSQSVGVYLDAESANNSIINNRFELKLDREVIAVDGSRKNLISGNTFPNLPWGGVYVYRNCGERGMVRHQKPTENRIISNTFNLDSLRSFWEKNPSNGRQFEYRYAIWLGSRESRPPSFCDEDEGFPFGSSIDNGDFANDNIINGNVQRGNSNGYLLKIDQNLGIGGYDKFIRDDGSNNRIDSGEIAKAKARTRLSGDQKFARRLELGLANMGTELPVMPSRDADKLLAAMASSNCRCLPLAGTSALGLA